MGKSHLKRSVQMKQTLPAASLALSENTIGPCTGAARTPSDKAPSGSLRHEEESFALHILVPHWGPLKSVCL